MQLRPLNEPAETYGRRAAVIAAMHARVARHGVSMDVTPTHAAISTTWQHRVMRCFPCARPSRFRHAERRTDAMAGDGHTALRGLNAMYHYLKRTERCTAAAKTHRKEGGPCGEGGSAYFAHAALAATLDDAATVA